MRRLLCIVGVTILSAVPACSQLDTVEPAQAHRASFPIHKVFCAGIGKLCDKAPPGPNMACTEDRAGVHATVFDPILGAYVEWECRCPFPRSCSWFRLRIVPDTFYPWWDDQPRRWVYDWHRACRAIVCKRVKVIHYWPRLVAEGGRR